MPASNVKQFLQSNFSFTNFFLKHVNSREWRHFLVIKKTWCMELAHVDWLSKHNNGVKYLLVHQDLIGRPQMQKERKQKLPKKWFVHFWLWLQKNRPQKNWVDKRTEFAAKFKNLSKAERVKVYSTTSGANAAFDESIIPSLKNILYRYMGHKG